MCSMDLITDVWQSIGLCALIECCIDSKCSPGALIERCIQSVELALIEQCTYFGALSAWAVHSKHSRALIDWVLHIQTTAEQKSIDWALHSQCRWLIEHCIAIVLHITRIDWVNIGCHAVQNEMHPRQTMSYHTQWICGHYCSCDAGHVHACGTVLAVAIAAHQSPRRSASRA